MKTLGLILLAIGVISFLSGHWLTAIIIESGAWECWTWNDDDDDLDDDL
jgi:hypothetical protein